MIIILKMSDEINTKVIFLTSNDNALDLYGWISQRCKAVLYRDKLTLEYVKKIKPFIIISYNYKYYISKECIDYMQERIINLHISLLPWNKGASPNIWSFIDNTPKGVTIHCVSEKLDEGDILFQKEIKFDNTKESFESTYKKLNDALVELFKENWNSIIDGSFMYIRKKQLEKGSKHSTADLQSLIQNIDFEWKDNINDFLLKYRAL